MVCGSPARNLTFTENPEPGAMTSTHQLGSLPKGLVQVSVSGLVKLHRCSGTASPLQPTKIAFETILKWTSDKSVGTWLDIYWKSLDQSMEIIWNRWNQRNGSWNIIVHVTPIRPPKLWVLTLQLSNTSVGMTPCTKSWTLKHWKPFKIIGNHCDNLGHTNILPKLLDCWCVSPISFRDIS